MAVVAELKMGDFNPQNLANTACAFATADQADVQLFMALARCAVRRTGDFNEQVVTNTLWAFATAVQSDVQLFMAFRKVL